MLFIAAPGRMFFQIPGAIPSLPEALGCFGPCDHYLPAALLAAMAWSTVS